MGRISFRFQLAIGPPKADSSLENARHIGSRLRVGRCRLRGTIYVLVAALLIGWKDGAALQAAAARIELPIEQGDAQRTQYEIDNGKCHGPAI